MPEGGEVVVGRQDKTESPAALVELRDRPSPLKDAGASKINPMSRAALVDMPKSPPKGRKGFSFHAMPPKRPQSAPSLGVNPARKPRKAQRSVTWSANRSSRRPTTQQGPRTGAFATVGFARYSEGWGEESCFPNHWCWLACVACSEPWWSCADVVLCQHCPWCIRP